MNRTSILELRSRRCLLALAGTACLLSIGLTGCFESIDYTQQTFTILTRQWYLDPSVYGLDPYGRFRPVAISAVDAEDGVIMVSFPHSGMSCEIQLGGLSGYYERVVKSTYDGGLSSSIHTETGGGQFHFEKDGTFSFHVQDSHISVLNPKGGIPFAQSQTNLPNRGTGFYGTYKNPMDGRRFLVLLDGGSGAYFEGPIEGGGKEILTFRGSFVKE